MDNTFAKRDLWSVKLEFLLQQSAALAARLGEDKLNEPANPVCEYHMCTTIECKSECVKPKHPRLSLS